MKSIASRSLKVMLTSPRFKIPRGECGGMEVGEKELEDELESEQHHELKPGWSWFSCLFPSVRGLRVCDP